MSKNLAIDIRSISKCYKLGQSNSTLRETLQNLFKNKSSEKTDFWALNDVSLTVAKGEAVGIIGKNGAGKSTLLKILSRITAPTSGEIEIQGNIASLLEVGTGFHPELTGRENIFLNGSILGMSRKEINSKLPSIIEFSGIKKFLETPVKHYSSGMYVRLAFAVAAHLEPDILVIDEVLSVGDAEFQKKCMGKMGDVTDSGKTVLFVSHNMEAVRKLCQKTIWLEKGKVKQIGNSNEIIDKYLGELKESAETIKPGLRTDREGSGQLKVDTIEFSSPDSDQLKSGNELRINVSFKGETDEKFSSLVTLGVHDHSGTRILTLSTKFHHKLVQLENNSKMEWKVPHLNLTPGIYFVNTFVAHRTESDILDWLKQAASFEVTSSSYFSESDEIYYPKDKVFIEHEFEVI